MKPTQKQIEREAIRLFSIRGLYDVPNGSRLLATEPLRNGWHRLALHVLRRIAAAERRGYNLGRDSTEAKYDDFFESERQRLDPVVCAFEKRMANKKAKQ